MRTQSDTRSLAPPEEPRLARATQQDTKDEEASGVIPAPFPGDDAYLLDEQVHLASSDPELVEGGQFMELRIPSDRSG